MSGGAEHWETVFNTRAGDEVSWHRATAATSRRLLGDVVRAGSSLLDVGAGTSILVDELVAEGLEVTALDVSAAALDQLESRLGPAARHVDFVCADLRTWQPTRTWDAWHDRAVFHFLLDTTDRDAYVAAATAAVTPGGVLVLGVFAPDGPEQCSGLPTARYGAESLAALFAGEFALEHTEREEHVTPWGAVQPFTWVRLRRAAPA